MDTLITALLYVVAMFVGGASIGGAIENYKNGKHGGCGINIMLALAMIKLMFAI